MAVDLNMDMGELIEKLFKKKSSTSPGAPNMADDETSKPYKIVIISVIVMVLVTAALIFLVVVPYNSKNVKKVKKIDEAQKLQKEIATIDQQRSSLKKNIDDSKEKYENLLNKFVSRDNSEALYELITTISQKNNINIENIKSLDGPNNMPLKKKEGEKELPYQESKMDVTLKGDYINYINFRDDLANNNKILNIESENIMVSDKAADAGKITANLKLIAYVLDKESYETIIKGQ